MAAAVLATKGASKETFIKIKTSINEANGQAVVEYLDKHDASLKDSNEEELKKVPQGYLEMSLVQIYLNVRQSTELLNSNKAKLLGIQSSAFRIQWSSCYCKIS